MPNLCKRNHDKDIVGVTKWRKCRQCERDRNRIAAQERRNGTRPIPGYLVPDKRVKPVSDGLEAEYGPIPDLVPNSEWFDEVIVARALNRVRCGRSPYPLEWAEIIRRMPRAEVTDEDVAFSTGTTAKVVSLIRSRHE